MKLVDMHHKPGEGANELTPAPMGGDYPCGLRLQLGEAQLKELGIDELPTAGTKLHLEARAVVTRSATEDPDADGDVDYVCVELQVTELGLEEGDDEEEEDPVEARNAKARKVWSSGR